MLALVASDAVPIMAVHAGVAEKKPVSKVTWQRPVVVLLAAETPPDCEITEHDEPFRSNLARSILSTPDDPLTTELTKTGVGVCTSIYLATQ